MSNNYLENPKVYSEVYAFLNAIGSEFTSKIPDKLIAFFENNRDKDYNPVIDSHKPIKEQNLQKNTIVIISKLNLQYWASEEQKNQLIEIYKKNDNN